MSIPTNITKAHLERAIQHINERGIPTDGDSQYYDVLYDGKRYPPKLAVSYANIYANGSELDRRSFDGGKNTPCFKLLESHGFKIIPKLKLLGMNSAKIYEIKSGAAVNYAPLLAPNKKYFFWNSAKFGGNQVEDVVFVVNRHNKEALYTKIAELGIQPTYDSKRDVSTFNSDYHRYEAAGEWEEFIKFEVIDRVSIPADWNWSRQLGQSETYILWQNGVKDPEQRLEKVRDLQQLFQSETPAEVLNNIAQLLGGTVEEKSTVIDFEKIKNDPKIKELSEATSIWFEKAFKVFEKFKAHQKPVDFYHGISNLFSETNGGKYLDFIEQQLAAGSEEQDFARLMGQLVSYMDANATNKIAWNETEDKRVFTSGIYMKDWIANLLRYKINGNNYDSLTIGIRNALEYATNPMVGIPIVSEDHKALIAEKLLNKPYNRQLFVSDLNGFFEKHGISAALLENTTALYTSVLYHNEVRPSWNVSIGGLVANDPNKGNWIQEAISALEGNNGIVIWWSKMPSGTGDTISLLEAKIKRDRSFELFYAHENFVRYRAIITDVATEDNYKKKNWGELEGIAWAHKNFDEYTSDDQVARIAFIAESIEPVSPSISIDSFVWHKSYQKPKRVNLQPFESYNYEGDTNQEEIAPISFTNDIAFETEDGRYFNAIQTKPFILLAGISGTGKSRLVRKLAYKTCYLDELRDDNRPGNFELIPVLPNWHDSSELIGYESRLSGKLEYKVTTFLRFLAKAHRYPQVPFFLCLDEMNLAPVEQYFAEYLSIIETCTYKGSEMITDPFISAANLSRYADAMGEQFWIDLGISDDPSLQNKFLQHGIQLSANLVVMGTVNMDETTHSFSRKVLDRAMTIEMNQVNLMDGLETAINDLDYPDEYYHPSLVFGNLQGGQTAFQSLGKAGKTIIQQLEDINKILEGTPFKLAYRVRDELLVYCYYGSKQKKQPTNWVNRCMDEVLDMKLLPRIEGDKGRCEKVIDELIAKLPVDFENCHLKLKTMKAKLDNQGFTSYWD
ncbi:MAG: hypothetical protein Q8J69_08985 [Sphingobacteriaceae bacterium]|nr:hypothetical protein [Sphingobacteriaceae bacterium]